MSTKILFYLFLFLKLSDFKTKQTKEKLKKEEGRLDLNVNVGNLIQAIPLITYTSKVEHITWES